MSEQWAVCRTFTGREHVVRREIEKINYGAFLPTYRVTRALRGRMVEMQRAFIPGYVFFRTTPEGWGDVAAIDDVLVVLADGRSARRIADEEMVRLMLEHATGAHNRIERLSTAAEPRRRRRRRRPRPGKRYHGSQHA